MSAYGGIIQPKQVFEMGWENAQRSTDQYWSPTTADWPRFAASDVTRIPHGPGLGEPNPVRVDGRFRITLHAEVESSWQNAKMNHPAAIWSPRDGMWYDHHGSGGGAGKPPPLSQAAKALAQRLEEIKNLPIDDVQKQQQTQRALRDYADQLAAPPP